MEEYEAVTHEEKYVIWQFQFSAFAHIFENLYTVKYVFIQLKL